MRKSYLTPQWSLLLKTIYLLILPRLWNSSLNFTCINCIPAFAACSLCFSSYNSNLKSVWKWWTINKNTISMNMLQVHAWTSFCCWSKITCCFRSKLFDCSSNILLSWIISFFSITLELRSSAYIKSEKGKFTQICNTAIVGCVSIKRSTTDPFSTKSWFQERLVALWSGSNHIFWSCFCLFAK